MWLFLNTFGHYKQEMVVSQTNKHTLIIKKESENKVIIYYDVLIISLSFVALKIYLPRLYNSVVW